MKIAALIPAHNDDYTLWLALQAAAPAFDEVLVLDDCSDDLTPDVVLDCARLHPHVRLLRHEGRQLGWVEARNALLAKADTPHLFWMDADDVLADGQADVLRQRAESHCSWAPFELVELWGDLDHTTQRLSHSDRCHCYTNLALMPDFRWTGCAMAKPQSAYVAGAYGPLVRPRFFHCKGVKSDRRLVERQMIRAWLRTRPTERLCDLLDNLTADELHARARDMLLTSRTDRIQPTYRNAQGPMPARPAAIRAAQAHPRFEMVYQDGLVIDRRDNGWTPDLK